MKDADSFALIEVARLEMDEVRGEEPGRGRRRVRQVGRPRHTSACTSTTCRSSTRTTLRVDYMPIFREAVEPGLRIAHGRRLAAVARREHPGDCRGRRVRPRARPAGRGRTGRGAWGTRPARCRPTTSCSRRARASPTSTRRGASPRRAAATGCRWRSATSTARSPRACATRRRPKRGSTWSAWRELSEATGCPLVLHGGSGIKQEYVLGLVQARHHEGQRGHGDPPGVRAGSRGARERRRGRAAGVLRAHVRPADRVVLHRGIQKQVVG